MPSHIFVLLGVIRYPIEGLFLSLQRSDPLLSSASELASEHFFLMGENDFLLF